MIVNLSPDQYYTQRNNRKVQNGETGIIVPPSCACMPTARVMFYEGNKIQFINPTVSPADEYFTARLIDKDAVAFARSKYPGLSNYPPNQIHGMYGAYLDQIVAGYRASDFVSNLTWQSIHERIEAGEVIMTSGKFYGVQGPIDGHAFCFIGIADSGDLLMADPYGDHRTGYASPKGYAVPMTEYQFDRIVKPLGNKNEPNALKWGHIPLKKEV